MTEPSPVIIADYDPDWPQVFADLKAAISVALGDLALAVEHVGSTYVPGLPAKPIIDLDVVLAGIEQLPQVVQVLSKLGYVHQDDLGIPEREAFAREGEDVPRDGTGRAWMEHHLYACANSSRELRRHLAFRDHLRANPETATAYGELKRASAGRFRHDREAYCEAKTEFVEGVLRKAMGTVIREATRDDVPLLTGLICQSFRDLVERFGLTQENCPSHPSNTSEEVTIMGRDLGNDGAS